MLHTQTHAHTHTHTQTYTHTHTCRDHGMKLFSFVYEYLHVVSMVTLSHYYPDLFFLFKFDFWFCGCCIYVTAFCPPPSLSFSSSPPLTQGSWWSNRRAVSPPSSSQDSMGEGGWDSPKPRPPDSPLWSMRVVKKHTLTLISMG